MKERWKSLKFRLPLLSIAGMLVISVILLVIFYSVQMDKMRSEVEGNYSRFAHLFDEQLEINKQNLSMSMELLLNDKRVVEMFRDQDREGLTSLLLPIFEHKLKKEFDVAQFQFHTPPATSFLRLHKPSKFDDDLSSFRSTVLQVNKNHQPVAGIEVGRGGPGLRIVYPVTFEGVHLGSVEFGGSINSLLQIADAINSDFAIGIKKDVFEKARRFTDETNDVVLGDLVFYKFSKPDVKDLMSAAEFDDDVVEFEYNDKSYSAGIFPLKDYSGNTVGEIKLFKDITEARAAVTSSTINSSLLVLGIAAVIALFFYSQFRKVFLLPLGKIVKFVEERQKGITNQFLDVDENEEFIYLADSLNNMAEKINQQLGYLDELPAPVMFIDTDYNIQYMNKAGAKLLSTTNEKLFGSKCYDSFKTEHCQTENCACFKSMKFNDNFTEETVSRATGDDISIQYSAIPIKDRHGNITGALEFVADISKIKNIENYLNRSTKNILKEMSKFSEGDLSVFAKSEKTGDDVSALFEGFNNSVSNIRAMIEQLKIVINDTAVSSNQISSSTEEMAAGAQEQNMQAQEVAKAVDEMTKSIIETSQSATKAREMAEVAGKIAEEGGIVVRETVSGIDSIAKVISETSETVKTLGQRSNEIGEIVEVIEEIADQTNLLALNAAIEAARAGEQGRGFAVVADEVRKLAERTGKATKEIATMIKNIQGEAHITVASIEKGNSEMSKGRELAQRAGNSLEEIIVHSKDVVDAIIQVASASEQQSKAAEQISLNIDGITQVTHESSAGIQQIARASENLNNLTNNLQQMVSQFHNGNGSTETRRLSDKEKIALPL
ncbi:MAG: hypothetical protein SCALA702_05330 [Melioribacteraceae bacterium]|nr:MAG: hypothetical protein SCALA702_05330 [Melioribacteraceae bacterium]